MDRKCLQCENTKMIQIGKRNPIPNTPIVKHKGDGFLYKDTSSNLTTNSFVCPKCGLIQQYVPEDELKYLEDI